MASSESKKIRLCEVCAKKAKFSCTSCQVSYCCKNHELDDWKMHLKSCPCYKVVKEASKRSHLIALRNIPKGVIIFESKPLVIGPLGTEPVCLGCLQPMIYDIMSNLCDGCGWPVCSVACAQSTAHQLECQAMQKAGFRFDENALRGKWHGNIVFAIFPSIWILVLRVLLSGNASKLIEIYREEDHEVHDKVKASHLMLALQGGVTFIRNTLKLENFEKNIICCVTKIMITLLAPLRAMQDKFNCSVDRLGYGVYVSDFANLQHACLPNVRLIETLAEPETMKVVALADIGVGEMLCAFKSEDEIQDSTLRRQLSAATFGLPTWEKKILYLILQSTWKGEETLSRTMCTCSRCADPKELDLYLGSLSCMKCSGKTNGMMVSKTPERLDSSDFVCERCDFRMPPLKYISANTFATFQFMMVKNTKDINLLVQFIEMNTGQNKMLHYNHELILSAKRCYCEYIFANSSVKGASKRLNSKVLQRYYRYISDLNNFYGEIRADHLSLQFQEKLMCSKNIIWQWMQGNLTRNEADAQMQRVYRDVVNKSESSIVDRDEALMMRHVVTEILVFANRLQDTSGQ